MNFTGINWKTIFEAIDIDAETQINVYKIKDIDSKRNYYNLASYNLTVQYLKKLKAETFFLDNKRKIEFIEGQNILKPKPPKSDNKLFNQTVFNAQSNFYEFVQWYLVYLKYRVDNSDSRYFLKSFFDKSIRKSNDYLVLSNQIKENKKLHFLKQETTKYYNVYTVELMIILSNRKLPATNLETKKDVVIDGNEYLKTYIDAYDEGIKYFNQHYLLSTETLYNKNEDYVRSLHYQLYHNITENNQDGWIFVKTAYPTHLTHEAIKHWGYYSGIISELDNKILQHPTIFKDIDKCDHNGNKNAPQPTETKTEQATPTFTNNFDKIKPIEIHKHFKAGLVEKGYLTEQELNEYLKSAFELKTTPETLFKIKDAPNKAAIEAVFYTYYKNVAGKMHGKQKQYAALLGDYFEGYKTTTVSSNFSKSVY